MKLTAHFGGMGGIGIYTESGRRVATMSSAQVDTGMPQWELAQKFAAAPEMAELLERFMDDVVNQPEHRAEARDLLAKIKGSGVLAD